jgi:ABC-type transporter Mla subunit MlaD
MTDDLNRLVLIVERMGEAVIATTETVERLAERVDALVTQVQNQGHQVQQQSYQIFALSDALQTFLDSQSESRAQLNQLTHTLEHLVAVMESNSTNHNS